MTQLTRVSPRLIKEIKFNTVAALLADTTTLVTYQARYGTTGTVNVKANNYDTKLAAAFAKWQGIRDTPWTPEPEVTHPDPQEQPSGIAALIAAILALFDRRTT